RAPSWSVKFEDLDFHLDCLAELGYEYDSSITPFKTHLYGDRRFPAKPFLSEQGIVELPLAPIGFPPAPWAGGFYFRLIPNKVLSRWVMADRSSFLYLHPWELYQLGRDARRQLRPKLSLSARFITHARRRSNSTKWKKFLSDLRQGAEMIPMR